MLRNVQMLKSAVNNMRRSLGTALVSKDVSEGSRQFTATTSQNLMGLVVCLRREALHNARRLVDEV